MDVLDYRPPEELLKRPLLIRILVELFSALVVLIAVVGGILIPIGINDRIHRGDWLLSLVGLGLVFLAYALNRLICRIYPVRRFFGIRPYRVVTPVNDDIVDRGTPAGPGKIY